MAHFFYQKLLLFFFNVFNAAPPVSRLSISNDVIIVTAPTNQKAACIRAKSSRRFHLYSILYKYELFDDRVSNPGAFLVKNTNAATGYLIHVDMVGVVT